MEMMMAGNWWVFVLRGILAILFGILAFLWPGMTLLTLVFLFGIYSIVDGVFNIVSAVRRTGADQRPWWVLLILGAAGIVAGLVAFFFPGLTAMVLLYVIAAWAVVTGVVQIAAAVRLRKYIRGEWLLALAGILSVLFGVLLVMFPGAGALTVVLWIGAYAVALGVLLVALGMRLRNLSRAAGASIPYDGGTVVPSH